MKKTLRFIIILTLCCLLPIMSGCAPEGDTDPEFLPVTEIRENFSKYVEDVRSFEFDNLDFSNAEFKFPEIDSISLLERSVLTGKSVQELYDFFSASLDTFVPGEFSEEEKQDKIIFYGGKKDEGPAPTLKEYDSDSENPWPAIDDEKCFMDMAWGVLRWLDNGDLIRWEGQERKPGMGMLNDGSREVAEYISDLDSEKKYELINGEMSVKDAVAFANDFLQTTDFSPYETDTKSKVVKVLVVDIGKGKYGYDLIITDEYKNVLFDYPEVNDHLGGGILIENPYDSSTYDTLPHHVNMIEADKVYNFIIPAEHSSFEEKEIYASIIPLKRAAKIVSELYSGTMDLSVQRVEVVYLTCSKYVEPCWKFLMHCNGCCYHTFVNMHTGEIHVYVEA